MFQVSVAFLVLAWFAVSMRVYARAVVLRSFHWDDFFILLALCVFTACCSCLIAIENIEKSDAASTALLNGLEAQLGLIDTIFGVSYMHTVWYNWSFADQRPSSSWGSCLFTLLPQSFSSSLSLSSSFESYLRISPGNEKPYISRLESTPRMAWLSPSSLCFNAVIRPTFSCKKPGKRACRTLYYSPCKHL